LFVYYKLVGDTLYGRTNVRYLRNVREVGLFIIEEYDIIRAYSCVLILNVGQNMSMQFFFYIMKFNTIKLHLHALSMI